MKQLGLSIHAAMLADRDRNASLRAGVEAIVKPGDVVVDVGTGTGYLAMLAVRAGARRVYAVDAGSTMASLARQLIEANHMAAAVTLVQARSTDYTPPEPADVILCETLGFAGLDEGFRPTLADARDRMLRPGGALLPAAVAVRVAPVEPDPAAIDITRLDAIEGLDFTAAADVFRRVYQRRYVPAEHELAPARTAFELDCRTMAADAPLETDVTFAIERSGQVSGFALWFDSWLAPGVMMSNRLPHPSNHWGQTFLPLPEPISVAAGDALGLHLAIADDRKGFRMAWRRLPVGAREEGRA